MKSEFKPCPFCGETEDICTQYNGNGTEWIQCICGASGPSSIDNEDYVGSWNNRVGITEINKTIDKFKIEVIDSYRFHQYEKLMDEVNIFCSRHEVVDIKHNLVGADIIYSIIYKV
jgi:hypothetical protein